MVKNSTPATTGATGWCLEAHDLAVSKLAAGRDKDLAFVEVMVRGNFVSADVISERLDITPRLTDQAKQLAVARLRRSS